MGDADRDRARRAWTWLRVHGAQPAEAVYLAAAHPTVDPARDVPAAADLLTQYRKDRTPNNPTTR